MASRPSRSFYAAAEPTAKAAKNRPGVCPFVGIGLYAQREGEAPSPANVRVDPAVRAPMHLLRWADLWRPNMCHSSSTKPQESRGMEGSHDHSRGVQSMISMAQDAPRITY